MASDETEKKSTAREYYEALLIAVIFVNFARIFVFQAFKIPTGSMEDNLKIGDHIIVNKFIFGHYQGLVKNLIPLRDIRRGDIIVFRYPLQPDTDFVKRVILRLPFAAALNARHRWFEPPHQYTPPDFGRAPERP